MNTREIQYKEHNGDRSPSIIIQPYNQVWAVEFAALKEVYASHLSHLSIDIQHVGSTSVPGLSAKPVLDIDIVVSNEETSNQAIKVLAELGYNHVGDLGIPQRKAFKRADNNVPYTNTKKEWQKHNLYVCISGCASVQNHLQFRDYLLANADAVVEYSQLKKQLAAKYPNDIDSYVAGKTAFITGILKEVGFDDNELREIEEQNRVK